MRPVIMAFLIWLLLLLIVIGSSSPASVAGSQRAGKSGIVNRWDSTPMLPVIDCRLCAFISIGVQSFSEIRLSDVASAARVSYVLTECRYFL